MCFICCDCGKTIHRKGRRGRPPKRCRDCNNSKRRAGCRKRPGRGEGKHALACQACGDVFRSVRPLQKYCSPACARLGSRTRVKARCANDRCGKEFETKPGRLAKGHRFCSRDCSYHEPLVCQNPECGRLFRMKHRTKDVWKNKGKYCCPECYQDHRWGKDRPRQPRSQTAKLTASRHALATSLRKRCKVYGVTFDPACTREAVLERDSWVCQKCRRECNKDYKCVRGTRRPHKRNAEHDHIIPLSVPGSPGNVFENSQCLCRECNSKKRDKPQGQLRLPIEEEAWGKGVRVRRQQSSRSCVATLAAAH